ncbi:hypothetical protein ABES01_22545, partial [Paenibacillus rhizolycopersici]|uniref:hypothetical protein n=1 Tax=Paenibacillus rhizolycopersici TaxID=2780073 RepID=UPI003D29D87F
SLNNLVVRLASLGAVWQQGVIPQEQTTRWTGGYDFLLARFPKSPTLRGKAQGPRPMRARIGEIATIFVGSRILADFDYCYI